MTLQKREEAILQKAEYKLTILLMSIPWFCGLLQTDGHFTVTYDKEKGQNPKIILTQNNKRSARLEGIQTRLHRLGISSTLPTSETLIKKQSRGQSINLTIDRAQCRKLLSLIEKTEKNNRTHLLFDIKLVIYL